MQKLLKLLPKLQDFHSVHRGVAGELLDHLHYYMDLCLVRRFITTQLSLTKCEQKSNP